MTKSQETTNSNDDISFFGNINLFCLTGEVLGFRDGKIFVKGDDGSTIEIIADDYEGDGSVKGSTAYIDGHLSASKAVADRIKLFAGEEPRKGNSGDGTD